MVMPVMSGAMCLVVAGPALAVVQVMEGAVG